MFGRILFGVGERLMGRFACLRRRGVYSLRSIDSPVSYLNGPSVQRGNPLRGASVDQQGKVWMFERRWLVGFSRPRAQMPLWHLLRRGSQRSIPLRGGLLWGSRLIARFLVSFVRCVDSSRNFGQFGQFYSLRSIDSWELRSSGSFVPQSPASLSGEAFAFGEVCELGRGW